LVDEVPIPLVVLAKALVDEQDAAPGELCPLAVLAI
jgi:hypothetical protein